MEVIMRALPAVAIASLILASCAPQPPDMTKLKKTTDEFNAASKDALMSGNAEKSNAWYEENATELNPGMAMIKGKAAILEAQNTMMKSGMKITAVTMNQTDLQASGTMAYESGTYEMSMSVPKMGDVTDRGKYMTIWHQQADGSWKVYADMYNSDMQMAPMAQDADKKDSMKKK
jgi:ketosteroid isomerase-like protein